MGRLGYIVLDPRLSKTAIWISLLNFVRIKKWMDDTLFAVPVLMVA